MDMSSLPNPMIYEEGYGYKFLDGNEFLAGREFLHGYELLDGFEFLNGHSCECRHGYESSTHLHYPMGDW